MADERHAVNPFPQPESPFVARVKEAFSSQGCLASVMPGFVPREQQVRMAAAVAAALENNETLVVEAGTGVGKTFAYLLPALASGGKVIVSTGTKNLQDQLFRKDLPLVRRALARNVNVALLKGRSNYLCTYRLRQYAEFSAGKGVDDASDLRRIEAWARRTPDGDIAGLSAVPETAPIWPKVTSTAENCLGQECPDIGDCHVLRARRAAQEADVVVINHHLFFADLALKEEGFGEILPSANAFILDEAHQLAEIAGQFFGDRLGSRSLKELGRDATAAVLSEAPDNADLHELARDLEHVVRRLGALLAAGPARRSWEDIAREPKVEEILETLETVLSSMETSAAQQAQRGPALQAVARRAQAARARLGAFREPETESVRWCEIHARGFSLNITPLDVASTFVASMARYPAAWIFTSATLAIGNDFKHFNAQLGLVEPHTLQLDSPFDYARQALIWRPTGLPAPNAPDYIETLLEAVLPLLRSNPGGAFLLFTSHRSLQRAANYLDTKIDRPLLIQNEVSRRELLERFRQEGNAILLGAQSFWEGVDVQGVALSCVLMDKLPFASPDDPLLKARSEALRARGGNPFWDIQLPKAVIAFKQGVGRLIRDITDRGVLIICDPRLDHRSYGKIFMRSLPPAPVTDVGQTAISFLLAGAHEENDAHG